MVFGGDILSPNQTDNTIFQDMGFVFQAQMREGASAIGFITDCLQHAQHHPGKDVQAKFRSGSVITVQASMSLEEVIGQISAEENLRLEAEKERARIPESLPQPSPSRSEHSRKLDKVFDKPANNDRSKPRPEATINHWGAEPR